MRVSEYLVSILVCPLFFTGWVSKENSFADVGICSIPVEFTTAVAAVISRVLATVSDPRFLHRRYDYAAR